MLFGPVASAKEPTGVGSWFKIDEQDYVDGKWASEIMGAANMTHEFKLPKRLPSGEYLLRSEMLALHGAQSVGGAQFYIGCAELEITGTGSEGACGPTIEVPGAYKAEDSDIYIPGFYNGFDATSYTAPGGPVGSCGGAGSTTPVLSTPVFNGMTPAASSIAAVPSVTISSAVASTAATPGNTTASALLSLLFPSTFQTSIIAAPINGTGPSAPGSTGSVGTVKKYGQCGGKTYVGATSCESGSTCTVMNDYYSQCV